jgi:hypothetical protein
MSGTILMVIAVVEGLFLSPGILAYGWVIGVVGVTALMDSFLAREIEPLIGSHLRWKRHYMPSAIAMHLGTTLVVVWGFDQSVALLAASWVMVIGGFLALLNQLTDNTALIG